MGAVDIIQAFQNNKTLDASVRMGGHRLFSRQFLFYANKQTESKNDDEQSNPIGVMITRNYHFSVLSPPPPLLEQRRLREQELMAVIYTKVKCLQTLVLFSSINGPARFCFSHCVHNISVPVYGPRFQNSVIFLAQEAQIDGYVGSRPRELNTSVAISKKKTQERMGE